MKALLIEMTVVSDERAVVAFNFTAAFLGARGLYFHDLLPDLSRFLQIVWRNVSTKVSLFIRLPNIFRRFFYGVFGDLGFYMVLIPTLFPLKIYQKIF